MELEPFDCESCYIVCGLLTTFSQSVLSVFSRIFASNFHMTAVVEIAYSQAPASPDGHLLLSGRFNSEQILNLDFGEMASHIGSFPSASCQNFARP